MKLWRSLLATVLAVLLVASMSVGAFAAYNDVPEGNEYLEYIKVVDSLGLIPANNVGDFNPKGYYTRGEAIITAYRMINGGDAGLENYNSNQGLYDDVDDTHPVLPYVNWAYDNGLITNEMDEKVFRPADPISAAEFLTLFVKVGGINPLDLASGGDGEGEGEGMGEEGEDMGEEGMEGEDYGAEMAEFSLFAMPAFAAAEDGTGEPDAEGGMTEEDGESEEETEDDSFGDEVDDSLLTDDGDGDIEEDTEDDMESGDGSGTTTGELVYPDSYIEAAFDWAGYIMGDEETITRENAAMAIAQLLWYQDSETSIDLTTLEDDEGNRLDCFATNIYGLNKIMLNIRATANRTMGYEFDGDVLLSNGNVLSTEEDLSKYIGHPITVTYRDMDKSSTLTEDEEIIDYHVNSLMILTPNLSEITLSNHTQFLVSSIGLSFYITNATKFYYNDQTWNEDPLNNLIQIAGGTGNTTHIANRPNMSFTVVPSEVFDAESGNNLVLEVFVEEHRPAKIVDISEGVYTLYDYYARGTDAEYVQYHTDNIVFNTGNSAVGDYVNYYTSGDNCYMLDGSALKTKIASIGSGNVLTLEDGTSLTPHQLYKRADTLPEIGKEMVIITEDVTGTYYLGWEYPTSKEKTPAMVINLTENTDSVTYVLYDCSTAEQITIEVPMDNVFADSRIEAGEFIYYSMDSNDQYSVERAKISDKVKLGVETEGYFVESSTGKIYNKSKYYYGNLYTDTFKEDYYKMILDVSGNVLALM